MKKRFFIKSLLILSLIPSIFFNNKKIINKKKFENYVWILDINKDFK